MLRARVRPPPAARRPPASTRTMTSRAAAPLLLLLTWLHGAVGCDNVTALSSALDTMLAEYERGAAPAVAAAGGGGGAVRVQLTLDVRHAAVIDAVSAVRLLADLRMNWEDTRLAWNATEWGCASALVSAERLWLPDVTLLNAIAVGSGAGDAALRARLTSAGRATAITRLDVTVPVALELADWPSDTHTALFKFASRAHTLDELDLTIQEFEYATVFESGAWNTVSVTSATSTWERDDEGERRVATWAVSLRRRAPAHATAARAVLAAAALMLLAAALLPPAARAPLCACASLTTSLWLVSALVRLPASGSTPRALALMCALCVCGAAACAAAALCARLARLTAPAPHRLRSLLITLSGVCQLVPYVPEVLSGECGGDGGGAGAAGGAGGAAWAAAARLLDRALLAALLLTVLVVACLSV